MMAVRSPGAPPLLVAKTPSAYIAKTVLQALLEAFPKPKHRSRLVRALTHAACRLGADSHVIRIRDKEPVSQANARHEAAELLHRALDELEMQIMIAETGGIPNEPSAAMRSII